MRTLFLIPPITTRLNRDFAATQVVPSYGVASIIGNIQGEFPEIALVDAFAERLSLKATVRRVADFNPDVIAISALTTQVHDAAETVAELKKSGVEAKTIIGGPHAGKVPEDTLREFPCFDYVGAVEGERLMLDALRAFREGRPAEEVPGVYRLRDGEVVSGGPRPFIEDVDNLEFPEWKHFRWDAYCASFRRKRDGFRELVAHINRGCPHNCLFCAKIMGARVRKRSVPGVIEEIERAERDYGANQILFSDETFAVDRGETVRLCEAMIERGLHKKIVWDCDTRPDKVDDELVGLMKRAGCFFLCFGADSVDDERLKFLNKNISGESIFKAVRLCRKHGITTQAAYILGAPGDTAGAIRKNIRGALAADSDFATFSILVPYPGTKIMEMAERGEGGLVLLSKNWRLYGKQLGYALETTTLNRKMLEKLQRNAYFRYYLRPSRIRNITRIASIKITAIYALAHLLRSLGILPGRG